MSRSFGFWQRFTSMWLYPFIQSHHFSVLLVSTHYSAHALLFVCFEKHSLEFSVQSLCFSPLPLHSFFLSLPVAVFHADALCFCLHAKYLHFRSFPYSEHATPWMETTSTSACVCALCSIPLWVLSTSWSRTCLSLRTLDDAPWERLESTRRSFRLADRWYWWGESSLGAAICCLLVLLLLPFGVVIVVCCYCCPLVLLFLSQQVARLCHY